MLRRLLTMAVLGLVIAVASPAVAQAATVSVVDDAGDVWKDTGGAKGGTSAAPKQDRGDIRRTTIIHTDRAILVRMKFEQLERTGLWFSLDVALRTKAGLARKATVLGGSEGMFGKPFWRGHNLLQRPNGREVKCAVKHNIDYAANAVRIRVPRSCLNAPRWVQARATYISATGAKAVFLDSSQSDRPKLGAWTQRIRRG